MYKDKDKQREAVQKAVKRFREREKEIIEDALNEGITNQGITNQVIAEGVIPEVIPKQGVTKGVTSEGMTHEEVVGMTEEIKQIEKDLVNMGITPKSAKPERTEHGFIRVSKPGDSDYVSICETTRRYINGQG